MVRMPSFFVALCSYALTQNLYAHSFSIHSRFNPIDHLVCSDLESFALHAKAKSKKKKTGSRSASVNGLKGFGGGGSDKKGENDLKIDRSTEAIAFYDFMERNGARDTISKVALGYFPQSNGQQEIRGVVALKPIKKGDVIIQIPYEMAVNLGPEGGDPTIPAVDLLRKYCESLTTPKLSKAESSESSNIDREPYYTLLPKYMGEDCLGSTDFYADDILDALQSPLVAEETKMRKKNAEFTFEKEKDSLSQITWIDGSPLTEQHLKWATWLITSRILTVEGDAEEKISYRLLIPFLDMCNHDRSSPHVLTGRAVPGGELKVVAGESIQVGDQINICYGGGVVGNDRFIQDYGFLENNGYETVAQQLIGKKRLVEGANAGRHMLIADRERSMEMLRQTKIKDDESLLAAMAENHDNKALKLAITYRLGVKKALSKIISLD